MNSLTVRYQGLYKYSEKIPDAMQKTGDEILRIPARNGWKPIDQRNLWVNSTTKWEDVKRDVVEAGITMERELEPIRQRETA